MDEIFENAIVDMCINNWKDTNRFQLSIQSKVLYSFFIVLDNVNLDCV
mgnify:CR=1 FL=1